MRRLTIRNRQTYRAVQARRAKALVFYLLDNPFAAQDFDLGILFLDEVKMAELNQSYLGHPGSTDIITFNYLETPDPARFHGELFISVPDAVANAARFSCDWREELMRCIIHGLLHLQGYDDHAAGDRARMKRRENKLLHQLRTQFDLGSIAPDPTPKPE